MGEYHACPLLEDCPAAHLVCQNITNTTCPCEPGWLVSHAHSLNAGYKVCWRNAAGWKAVVSIAALNIFVAILLRIWNFVGYPTSVFQFFHNLIIEVTLGISMTLFFLNPEAELLYPRTEANLMHTVYYVLYGAKLALTSKRYLDFHVLRLKKKKSIYLRVFPAAAVILSAIPFVALRSLSNLALYSITVIYTVVALHSLLGFGFLIFTKSIIDAYKGTLKMFQENSRAEMHIRSSIKKLEIRRSMLFRMNLLIASFAVLCSVWLDLEFVFFSYIWPTVHAMVGLNEIRYSLAVRRMKRAKKTAVSHTQSSGININNPYQSPLAS